MTYNYKLSENGVFYPDPEDVVLLVQTPKRCYLWSISPRICTFMHKYVSVIYRYLGPSYGGD